MNIFWIFEIYYYLLLLQLCNLTVMDLKVHYDMFILVPGPVLKLSAISNDSKSIFISWEPPINSSFCVHQYEVVYCYDNMVACSTILTPVSVINYYYFYQWCTLGFVLKSNTIFFFWGKNNDVYSFCISRNNFLARILDPIIICVAIFYSL